MASFILLEGGEDMDFILDLLREAAATVVKVVAKALTDEIISRCKNRTAPTENRDGSNNSD